MLIPGELYKTVNQIGYMKNDHDLPSRRLEQDTILMYIKEDADKRVVSGKYIYTGHIFLYGNQIIRTFYSNNYIFAWYYKRAR